MLLVLLCSVLGLIVISRSVLGLVELPIEMTVGCDVLLVTVGKVVKVVC